MRIAITGASSGIGAQVASKLGEENHEVTAFDLVEPKITVSEWIRTDLSDPESITEAVNTADNGFDGLVNNAGIPPKADNAHQVLNINFIGFRQFHELMETKLNTGASIVSTASRAGYDWRDNLQQIAALSRVQSPAQLDALITEQSIDPLRAYCLSKEAVIAYTKLRTEDLLTRQIRANTVSPSAVETPILDDFIRALGERAETSIRRAGRPGSTSEIADVICFLLSDKSHWIKGQDLLIDGGMSAMAETDTLIKPVMYT